MNLRISLLFAGIVIPSLVLLLTAANLLFTVALLVISLITIYCAVVFSKPIIALYVLIGYCFLFGIFGREFPSSIPYGMGIEAFAILAWLAVFVNNRNYDWNSLNNVVCQFVMWSMVASILQLFNPHAGSFMGWAHEVRGVALYPLLVVPLFFLLVKDKKDMNGFLWLILFFSLLAALNGIKQKHIGLFPGEQAFLDASPTHQIFGKIRVFSFYVDAGQFGASQASFMLLALVLAFGPFKIWKRVVLLSLAAIFCYGMLISGTRGSLFALMAGGFFAILLLRNFKVLFIGSFVALSAFVFLKYTTIGNGNYDILRLRSALDPQDPSLNLRFENQRILGDYMHDRPFGEGLGSIGFWASEYNPGRFLSIIQPDSYWVKVWAMFGIVGFTIWFCALLYVLGKACGIVWNLKDPGLRSKIIALLSTGIGLFVCSYGNEVMNNMPSLLVFYASLVLTFIAPKWDKEVFPKTSSS